MTPIRHCRSCNAPIYWCVTERGKRMPVDAEPAEPSESGEWTITRAPDGTTLHVRRRKEGEAGRHAHWATCPDAERHRKVEEREARIAAIEKELRIGELEGDA